MLVNVRPDLWCGAIHGKPGTILRRDQVYAAWTNSHGAVCGICENGELLGVKPDEFEVEEWFVLPSGKANHESNRAIPDR